LRIQVERARNVSGPSRFGYSNVFHGVIRIFVDEGWRGIFRGAGARIAFQVKALFLKKNPLLQTCS